MYILQDLQVKISKKNNSDSSGCFSPPLSLQNVPVYQFSLKKSSEKKKEYSVLLEIKKNGDIFKKKFLVESKFL